VEGTGWLARGPHCRQAPVASAARRRCHQTEPGRCWGGSEACLRRGERRGVQGHVSAAPAQGTCLNGALQKCAICRLLFCRLQRLLSCCVACFPGMHNCLRLHQLASLKRDAAQQPAAPAAVVATAGVAAAARARWPAAGHQRLALDACIAQRSLVTAVVLFP